MEKGAASATSALATKVARAGEERGREMVSDTAGRDQSAGRALAVPAAIAKGCRLVSFHTFVARARD